ncbi:hypothetical protein AMJ86_10225 [bacterium SM23_57]|nr:MAG: hypothetical protein AMJ86_10225 [bacterium SM23_57]
MTHILAWLLIIYGIATLWLLLGLSRRYPRSDKLPSVSLVICLRNEEHNLPVLFQALNTIDYPEDRLEIILVNDQSTDGTAKLIDEYQQSSRHKIILETLIANVPGFPGKMGAMIRGMDRATGDIIALTDANTNPRPDWIRQLVSHFDNDVGIVGGPIRITGKSIWSRLQALDWAYLFAAGAGTAGWGTAQSIFGKNVAIRASAYQEIGTLKAIPFSVTEDLTLLSAIRDRTKWKIRLPMEESVTLDAAPTPSLKTLWHQRRRWMIGGAKVSAVGRLLILIMLLLSVAILVSLFINPMWALGLFVIQCLLDLPLAASALGCIGRFNWLIYWPLYRAVFIAILIPLAASLLFYRSVHWKGHVHR